jgi:GT2 family glycosyltransferase
MSHMSSDTRTQSLQPSASIVVVSYNTAAHIEACLLSLLELDYASDIEIIVVDNGSSDGSAELIRSRFPGVDLYDFPDNKGFAGGASVGLFMATGDIVATVNPDVRLDPRWLSVMADTLSSNADAGIVGSKILYPDHKTIQHAGGVVHYPLATTDHIGRGETDKGQYDKLKEVSFVTGAALAMWREVGHSLQFFDPDFYPVYYEDVDLCWRADKEGLRTIYQPRAVAYHKESVVLDRTSARYFSYFHANRLRFVVKHYSPEQLMLGFLPAEAARVAGDMHAEDRAASMSLLDNGMLHESGPPAIPTATQAAPAAPTVQSTQHKLDKLQSHVAEVMGGWRVREKPFASSKPLVGRLIARVREQITNLSTRWYVRPILQQQVDYNASVARALREMSRQLAELEARVGVQALLSTELLSERGTDSTSVDELSEEITALRARLEQLEMELATRRALEQDVRT